MADQRRHAWAGSAGVSRTLYVSRTLREGGRQASTQARKGGKQGRKRGRAETHHSTCYKDSMRAVERHLSTACPLRASMHAQLEGG